MCRGRVGCFVSRLVKCKALLSLVKLQTLHTVNKDNEALKTETENLKTLYYQGKYLFASLIQNFTE